MPVFSKTLGNINYNDPESLKTLANHIRVMQEELEYRLANLDSSNVSEINMDDTNVFSSKGGLVQLLNETEESVAQLTLKNDEIASKVTEELDGVEERISTVEQTSESITATVEDLAKGAEHALKLDANGVYIVDGAGNVVTISGGQIEADSIYTNALHLGGDMVIHSTANGNVIGGYVGYSASLNDGTTSGMHIASADRQSDIAVTGNGARILYHGNYCAVTIGGVAFHVNDGTTGRTFACSSDAFFPDRGVSGDVTCGNALNKWTDIYGNNIMINTSDRNQKKDINYDVDSRYDELWKRLKPCTGKFIDNNSGRTHMFLISQDVEEALEEVGLSSTEFAGFIKSPDTKNGGYIYGLRYGEFIPLCIRHIQKLEDKVAELEARIVALES